MPRLLSLHFTNMWSPVTAEADLPVTRFSNQKSSQVVLAMMQIITPCVFAFAALGAIVLWRKWRELLFVYCIILLTIAQNLALYGSPRFRAPIEPILVLLTTGTIWFIWNIVQKLRHARHKAA